uniref:Uncharacterized protein n=1 Tax=Meloidogyne incognita TaxID=6306 RepID=A0A914LRD8_MELIC
MSQFTNATVRERRQSGGTPVASSGRATAYGSNTDLSSSNSMWKTPNGTVGANGTSSGNAAGAGPSNVMSQSNAMAGANSASNNGNVNAVGANSKASGMSASNVNGNTLSQSGTDSGSASGKGNSQVIADNMGFVNGKNTGTARGRAGATGNILTNVDLSVGQTLNWGSVMFSLSAISSALGENNSQANIMLTGSSLYNPALSAHGLVSGVNDNGGGNVFSRVSANGTGNGNSSQLTGDMLGGVSSKKGGSRLVGAETLTSGNSSSVIFLFIKYKKIQKIQETQKNTKIQKI